MINIGRGHLKKMSVSLNNLTSEKVNYQLELDGKTIDLNNFLGKNIQLNYLQNIQCTHCGRKTKKSFAQGYCYPCFTKLPQCDQCIMSPEKCHFHLGSCRDPSWGEQYCFQSHYVYLANSSGIKVGITRGDQLPTRWIDQGAIQALPIFKVQSRYQSGLIEQLFKTHVADKTNWRTMLKGQVEPRNLEEARDSLFESCYQEVEEVQQEFGLQAVQHLYEAEVVDINYPVLNYPVKVNSFNFDKAPLVEGRLEGIKGQYLILDTGVINIRKFTSYLVEFSAES